MTYALLEILCDLTLSWNCSHTIEIASHAKLVSSVTSIFARNLAQGGIFCRLCFVAWAIIISLFKIFIRRRYNINSVGEIMSAMIACIFILWKVIQSGFILLTFASKIYQIPQKTPTTHFRQKRGHTWTFWHHDICKLTMKFWHFDINGKEGLIRPGKAR